MRQHLTATGLVLGLAAALIACGGDTSDGGQGGGSADSDATGGTLCYFINKPVEHVDPQRIYVGRDITNFSRTVYRQLVTCPLDADPDAASTPVPDLPADNGPYKGDGQDLFDKAVTCDGNTITYRFKQPWPDFPLAIAALHMMDPYRQDKDQGARSNFEIFSNGPYKLDGAWSKNKGATFVRNDSYDPASDDPDNIRRALTESVVFSIGQTPEAIYDQLIADTGDTQAGVTSERVPPAYYNQIEGAVADRSVLVDAPYVDYLVPYFRSEAMSDPAVRKTLAVATSMDPYKRRARR